MSDGRVVTEFLKGDAPPKWLNGKTRRGPRRGLQADQRVVRPVLDGHALRVDRRAREQHRRRHDVHEHRERAPAPRRAARRARRARSALALWNAEFNGQKLDEKQAKDWIKQAPGLLDQAAALCGQFSTRPSNPKELGKVNHIVVIYEENHSFDNLYGGWEGVNGLRERRRGAHHAGQPGGERLRLPQAGRREPDVAAARA